MPVRTPCLPFEGGPASQSWRDTPCKSKGLLGTELGWEPFLGPRLELAEMPIC